MPDHFHIAVSVKGTRPLLQNAFSTNQSTSTPAKKGQIYDDQVETDNRLIKNENGEICQPALHFEASMIRSATEFKFKGRKTYKELFKAGVFVEPLLIPHKKPTYAIDKQRVVISRAAILRCRPRFDDWELDFHVAIHDDRIEPLVVKEILENAGKYHGIGDYRPRYGLYEVTSFEVQ
jgi:hypothetical protein